MSLFENSPGWHTQALAKILLDRDWDIEPFCHLARDMCDIFSAQRETFSNAGKDIVLRQIEQQRKELTRKWGSPLAEETGSSLEICKRLLQHIVQGLLPVITK